MPSNDPDIDVRIAEREVRSARARLGADLEAASKTSRRALTALKRRVRPFAIGVALVGGAMLLAGVVRLIRGALVRPKRTRFALPAPRYSLSRQLFNTAMTSAAGALASAATHKGIQMLNGVNEQGGHKSGHYD